MRQYFAKYISARFQKSVDLREEIAKYYLDLYDILHVLFNKN